MPGLLRHVHLQQVRRYRILEMLQNLILDFDEAAGNYKEQWAVCKALPRTRSGHLLPFDDHVLAYARKYDIKLVGPKDLDDIIANADEDVDLPVSDPTAKKLDPFGLTA
ncbi:hypothetical protein N0V88_004949 [Collariella sp. IMI 366227]|nr:hypothetical protein N0V88_004949 [Collariella sp. IMI 366227]